VRREHDHEGVRVDVAQFPEHAEPVAVGQPVVEQHQVRPHGLLHPAGRGARLGHCVALAREALAQ
jgi:hypothetical protein